jgi:hypothetical protein
MLSNDSLFTHNSETMMHNNNVIIRNIYFFIVIYFQYKFLVWKHLRILGLETSQAPFIETYSSIQNLNIQENPRKNHPITLKTPYLCTSSQKWVARENVQEGAFRIASFSKTNVCYHSPLRGSGFAPFPEMSGTVFWESKTLMGICVQKSMKNQENWKVFLLEILLQNNNQ